MCVFPTTTATCPDLTVPANGIINYNMRTTSPRPVDTVATYTCVTGYQMTGLMVRTCTATGWRSTGDDPVCTGEDDVLLNSCPVCTLTAICPDLPALANGMISYSPTSSPRLEGAMATQSCVTGYRVLSGGVTRTCQSVKTWNGSSLTCECM